MKRFISKKTSKNTIIKLLIVFFLISSISIININVYGNKASNKVLLLANRKTDKILYLFFSEIITNDMINNESINDILIVTKNNKDEVLRVDYDLEKSYRILNKISNVLKDNINDLENGKIDINIDDKYIKSSKNGLLLLIPFFINSNNVFINNIGPKIPVIINFNENILTNLKTKVTNYGFNNALLEVYISVELQKLIITPVHDYSDIFSYDILIGATVINGSVPNFYGGSIESYSNILDIP